MSYREFVIDAVFVAGIGVFGFGLYLVFPPAAFVWAGSALMASAVLMAKRG